MQCNECKYFDQFNESNGGSCHAMPPVLLRLGDDISEHRPFVALDDKACSLFKPEQADIGDLIA